ncbi:GntR family transcriptional regulator [Paralcaligenes sp. KSB-10]|uniref:GntR family transcriptional regulator n=1 Tax=Paralcaligenes sp. KSB-10 TaxID=2901142 RepID=UPI001E57F074|nr:GntR family transcriptional regulator [Paralcaligenes sp. KSB-10]UHL64781.1 GntR family transcriptional regulator [Paralcaligenes sp. KSB-10]
MAKSKSLKKSPSSQALLDPLCEEPLYIQIANRLATEISSARLAPGMRVPSEAELMTIYGVSRITVRQAIALLARNGQVVARRGKGTFVSRPPLHQDLSMFQGFQDALRNQGVEPQTELLEFSSSAGRIDRSLPEGLDLPVRMRRRYCVDDQPFAVVEAFLPASAAAVGERRARDLMVYEILQQFLGLRIDRADVVIRCAQPTAAVSRELAIDARANVLVMERTSRTAAGAICEFMRIYIVPERYAFRLSMPGPLEIASALRPVERGKKLKQQ